MTNFFLGLITGIMILPILKELTLVIISYFQTIESYLAVKINNNNQKIQQEDSIGTLKHAIGFNLEEEVDENNGI